MPGIQDTAYPRLRSQVSHRELAEVYTPTADELALARLALGARSRKVMAMILKEIAWLICLHGL